MPRRKLIAAWLAGIGGCCLLAWAGSRYDGPFRLLAGLWLLISGIVVWRKWYPGRIDVFSPARWGLGLIVLLVAALCPIIGGFPSFQFAGARSAALYFAWCVAVIGFAEELWWRGLWFEAWKGRPILCILAGSLAFDLYHFPFQGWDVMMSEGLAIRVFFFGLVFAAARYRGASIGVLALAHGLIDWSQGVIQWRREPGLAPFAICCSILTAIILGARGKESEAGC